MMIREPEFAGRFYADGADACRAAVASCLRRATESVTDGAAVTDAERVIGCIVPHAGWAYSGAVAARALNEIAKRTHPDVLVIFGAVHVPRVTCASVFERGAWETPLGLIQIEERLADRLLGQNGLLRSDAHAHEHEHSIEVEVPLIQMSLPQTRIVPIMVPADANAAPLGRAIGRTCRAYGVRVAFVGSTDLTHYGPSFGFTPRGVGPDGLRWADEVNDRRMIALMQAMEGEKAVDESRANQNACGAGAIAATIEACRALGAKRATLLEHTTSERVRPAQGDEVARDAVGYAALTFEG